MCPQEPNSLRRVSQLRVEIAYERDKGTSTSVGSNHRSTIWTSQWIFWMITDSSSKETSMKVQQICQMKGQIWSSSDRQGNNHWLRGLQEQCAFAKITSLFPVPRTARPNCRNQPLEAQVVLGRLSTSDRAAKL
jgi:hypothetical protein